MRKEKTKINWGWVCFGLLLLVILITPSDHKEGLDELPLQNYTGRVISFEYNYEKLDVISTDVCLFKSMVWGYMETICFTAPQKLELEKADMAITLFAETINTGTLCYIQYKDIISRGDVQELFYYECEGN